MGQVILGGTMSLDGFINDRNGSVEALYTDFEELQKSEPMRESIEKTGAVVMGRNTFAMSKQPEWYNDDYEYQVPIFVLTHTAPKPLPRKIGGVTFTFVTNGAESAVEQAKRAAGDKDVTIIAGANTAQQVLQAGLAGELHMDIMPVLLGGGLRLFEHIEFQRIRLERIEIVGLPSGRTGLKFRIVR